MANPRANRVAMTTSFSMCFTEKCGSKFPCIIIGNFMSSVAELLPLLRIAAANFSTDKPDL